jgi:hypothetical protein
MLNGIAGNKNVEHLVIDDRRWDRYHYVSSTPGVINAVFGVALRGGADLKRVTVVSQYEDRDERVMEPWEGEPPDNVHEAFERLGKELEFPSHKRHCIAQLRWSFPRNYFIPRLKSNMLWDSKFSPALVLNYLRRQPGGCPPAILLGLATRRINQGILFKYATYSVPWNLSASNASAIFETLYHSADHDWVQKTDA